MPLLTIYSDLHYGAPHSKDDILVDDIIREHQEGHVVLTGDIFDLKNTKKNQLHYYVSKQRKLINALGKDYVFGNHECEKPDSYFLVKEINNKRVLFCHGHNLVWPESKIKKWENKRPGKSSWRYLLYRLKHVVGREGKKLKLSKKLGDKCYDLCREYKCEVIIFGHTHKSYNSIYRGIKIINVPQGKTQIII